jgi:hypothetical protein
VAGRLYRPQELLGRNGCLLNVVEKQLQVGVAHDVSSISPTKLSARA